MHFAHRPRAARILCLFFCALCARIDARELLRAGQGARLKFCPIIVWPSGPLEVTASFDRPVDVTVARRFVGKSIRFVDKIGAAPDRGGPANFSGALTIAGAHLEDNGRTLVLATDPHPCVGRYVFPAASLEPGSTKKPGDETAVVYGLGGIEAVWSPDDAGGNEREWSGWWPDLDSDIAHRLTQRSTRHDAARALLSKPGHLVLNTLVTLPKGSLVALRLAATVPIEEAILGDVQTEGAQAATEDGTHQAVLAVPSQGDPIFLTITLRTGAGSRPFSLRATYRLGEEKTDHRLERDQLLVPWAPVALVAPATAPIAVPDLSGGDAARGKTIFMGDVARCSQCHTFRGQGTQLGPDLTEIDKKGRAEIYRAIAAPSAAIEAGYASYTVATKDGQVVVGVVRAEGPDKIRVTDTNARSALINRDQIQQIRPSGVSIMPVGLAAALGDGAVRDVIAYLTSSPSLPAAPAPR
jgi:putative heme-binding domain-containing protein